jgi:UDP-N-acetylmuramoylalanine--D-glutamate ligase
VIQKELEKIAIKAKKRPFSLTATPQMAAYTQQNQLNLATINGELQMELDELGLRGQHNLYNSMAAALSAASFHIQKESIRNSLHTFAGVEHRLESVCNVRGVEFINDSKATNVNSCWYALESMRTPVVLILGGTDKGNDYNEIKQLIKEKVHTLVFMGVDNSKLENFFAPLGIPFVSTHSMEEAVKAAYQKANVGDTVLLSPCCASFDLFKNYEDRGRLFKETVKAL